MNNLTKALVGTVAAGAMAVSTASPALARDRDGGIGAGEVIAGALVIGGIAAAAAAASKDNHYDYAYGRNYRDRYGRYYRGRYGYGMHPDHAVQRCVSAAQRHASRYGYGRANVTEITRIRERRDGFNIKGRLVVNSRHHRWGHRGYDEGKFSCKIRYGRVADVKVSGIRGYY